MNSILRIFAGVALGIALLASFRIDLDNTASGGAVDFRNRITGVRLMEHGIDPYHFIWHAGDPAEYCDLRNNLHLTVSKTTVTPTLLIIHAPLAILHYRQAQYLWLFGQWLLLAGTVWLWLGNETTPLRRWLIIWFVTGFTYTEGWRWEVERGQSYLLLAFIFASWMTSTLNPKKDRVFLTGCVAGLLVALRPPFMLLLPFLALHRRDQLIGALTGLALGVGLPLLVYPPIWIDYFTAMQTYSDLYRHDLIGAQGPQTFPPMIEGTSVAILRQVYAFPYVDFSLYGLLRELRLPPLAVLPLFAVGFFLLWLWWTRKQPLERLLPGLAAWFFLVDLFLPSVRYYYYDLLIANVVLAGIVTARTFPWAVVPCVLALPFSWAISLRWVLYYELTPSPALLCLPASLFTLGAILSLFSFVRLPSKSPIKW